MNSFLFSQIFFLEDANLIVIYQFMIEYKFNLLNIYYYLVSIDKQCFDEFN